MTTYQDLFNETSLIIDQLEVDGSTFLNGPVQLSALSAKGILELDATNNITSQVLISGQLLIGNSNNLPTPSTLTAGSGVTITNGAGSILIAANGTFSTDILPSIDATYSIGSLTGPKRWLNLYTSGVVEFDVLSTNALVYTNGAKQLQSASVSYSQANGNTSTLSFSGGILTGAFTNSQDLSTSGGPIFHNLGIIAGVYSDWFGNTDNTWNLGLPTKRWKTLYIAGISQFDILGATALVASDLNKQLQSVTLSPTNNLNMSFAGATLSASVSLTPSFTSVTDTSLASALVSTTAGGLLQNTNTSQGNGITLGFSGSTLTASASQDLSSGGNVVFNQVTVSNGRLGLGGGGVAGITYNSGGTDMSFFIGATTTLDMSATGAAFNATLSATGASFSGLAINEIVLTDGSKNLTGLGNASNGAFPIGSTGAAPVLGTITAGGGISVTNGPGSITIATDTTSLSASKLVSTNGSKALVSTTINNSNGANFALSVDGLNLSASLTQDLQTSGSPIFLGITTGGQADHLGDFLGNLNYHCMMGEATVAGCFLHVGSNQAVNAGATTSTVYVGNPQHSGYLQLFSGTANLNSASATLEFTGTSGSNTFNLPDIGGVTRDILTTLGGQTIVGAESITDTTQSTSTSTGCLKLSGGLGLLKQLWAGDEIHATLTTNASSVSTGSIQTLGGIGCAKTGYFKDIVITDTGDSTQALGTLTLKGGMSIGASVHFNQIIQNRLLVIWEDTANDHQFYGWGLEGGALQYHVSSTGADHKFYCGANSTTSNLLMSIKGTGQLNIPTNTATSSATTGCLVATGGIGCGGGINFGNETLNFFHYGSWTPALQSSSGSNAGVAYTTQTGGYCAIGPLVICSFFIQTSAKLTSAGNILITGLPITAGSTINMSFQACNGAAWAVTGGFLVAVNSGTTNANLNYSTGASSYLNLTVANMNAVTITLGCFMYSR